MSRKTPVWKLSRIAKDIYDNLEHGVYKCYTSSKSLQGNAVLLIHQLKEVMGEKKCFGRYSNIKTKWRKKTANLF
jgi:hypothetical protein